MKISPGQCVKLPDGRVARVRDFSAGKWRVRVRTKSGKSNQFLHFAAKELKVVPCPVGWMSVDGYQRYLKKTLAKMKVREKEKKGK